MTAVRLFVAVYPDEAVNAAADAALERALRRAPDADRWRPVARERRHVTLHFLADADPDATAAALRRALAGHPAPTLGTEGAGVFGTALWLGVRPTDPRAWAHLVAAAGGDPATHVPHLTVARCRGRVPDVPQELADDRGPAWTPREALLVTGGGRHRVVERFPLVGRPGAGEGVGADR